MPRQLLDTSMESSSHSGWNHDLFKLAPAPVPLAGALRLGVAVGVPLIGGLAMGKVLAGLVAATCAWLVTFADIGTTRVWSDWAT